MVRVRRILARDYKEQAGQKGGSRPYDLQPRPKSPKPRDQSPLQPLDLECGVCLLEVSDESRECRLVAQAFEMGIDPNAL
jgi:hypothetical protein